MWFKDIFNKDAAALQKEVDDLKHQIAYREANISRIAHHFGNIKPCPLCGGIVTVTGMGYIRIQCIPCDLHFTYEERNNYPSDSLHMQRGIDKWNRRAE